MHKFFNACLVLTALVSAFFLYSLEHSTRGHEREIAKLKNNILEEREQIIQDKQAAVDEAFRGFLEWLAEGGG